ncbi:hypothetical protein GYMLUDRAFT_48619 [Collybiopsis luxurians FD-317 M1]|uniref:Uncharacterized protein n=1 Tax=Collybiopsis luxurians FD-317 M1 TaxID=944289 RepID=A0A0D0AVF0_9AGAR|nr:hypothetical protein GYMLUDRAFT_48619 [Collybiopsis luxurians FD-317 M1]
MVEVKSDPGRWECGGSRQRLNKQNFTASNLFTAFGIFVGGSVQLRIVPHSITKNILKQSQTHFSKARKT